MSSLPRKAAPANVIGPQFRTHRVEAGLTQKELAELCQRKGLNLTRGTLAKMESGARFVKACGLFIIAKVLNVPLERFYPPGFGRG
ncbi:MAG: helix-turn-helix transcriptional regulator [Verrucomicrobia bacterium]|nr:helix-turn-helix transcriptional regulator [Verrucomicrobiota bacterium]